MLAGEPHIHVPERIPELSTRRLLTMEWLQGKPLMQFKASSQEDRNKLALRMFRAWYVPFYGYGVIHGDPHLGNYTVRDDLDLNLLDFGCIRVFRPRFVKGVIDLYWALVHDDRDLAVDAYESWGFAKLDNATVDVLNEWAAYLYGPLMEDRARLDRGDQQQPAGPPGGRARAPEAARGRRRHPAARVRVHGPGRDRPRRRVPAPEGRGELAPAVHGADRRLRRRRSCEQRQTEALTSNGLQLPT